MADRKISQLDNLAAADIATGDYLPIVDISEAAAVDRNKRIQIGNIGMGAFNGTAAAPAFCFASDQDTGMYRPSSDILGFTTGGTQCASFRGTGELNLQFPLYWSTNTSTPGREAAIHRPSDNVLAFVTNSSERVRIDASGRLLINDTSIETIGGANHQLHVANANTGLGSFLSHTSTAANGAIISLAKSRNDTIGSHTIVENDDKLGLIRFCGDDGVDFNSRGAEIRCAVDGTPGADVMPGRLEFLTNNGNNGAVPGIRMTILSDGEVGIGIENPTAKLTVSGDADSLTAQFIQADDTVDERIVLAQSTSGNNLGAYVDSSNVRHLVAGQNDVLTSNNGFLTLHSDGGTEGARLTSSGTFLIGGTGQNNANTVFQATKTSGTNDSFVESLEIANGEWARIRIRGRISGGSYREAWIGAYKHSGITDAVGFVHLDQVDGNSSYIWADNSNVLRISQTTSHLGTTNGTVVGTQTSDARLKNIGENVTYGLNEVLQLQPKQYTLKSEPDTNKLGFIAQEVESIIPEAVFDTRQELEGHQDGDRTQLGMEYVQLIPVLVNAIKEQQATITDLQTRLAALEGS